MTRLFLLPKKIDLRGAENFVREGPNIIIGNHCGAYKDVSLLLRTVPRMIYFTANQMIFTREQASELVRTHLHRHMGKFGGSRPFHPRPLLRLHGRLSSPATSPGSAPSPSTSTAASANPSSAARIICGKAGP
ncbi:MAG: hypothetical protein MZV64_12615 [Ignavibacteriales bacterium]|nr:hypothetical protein [Ignavibacteriales bacterium]